MELELEKYSYERREPTTINQCINDLVNGYADAKVYMELEKNLFELLEDKWFHQFPLLRYKYASYLLRGYYNGRSLEDNYIRGDPEHAIKILRPMAGAGLATAQYDVGRYYDFEKNDVESALTWIIKASKQEYHYAHKYLYSVWFNSGYKKFSNHAKIEFFSELARIYEGWGLGDWSKRELAKLVE